MRRFILGGTTLGAVIVAVLVVWLRQKPSRSPSSEETVGGSLSLRPDATGDGVSPRLRTLRAANRESNAVEVSVVDAHGEAAPGTNVRIFRPSGRADTDAWDEVDTRVTSGDGYARFPATAGQYLLLARKDNAGGASKVFVKSKWEAVTRISLVLEPLLDLQGTMETARGERVPLGRVELTRMSPGEMQEHLPLGRAVVTVGDARGAFRLEGLEQGSYRLAASAEGFRSVARAVIVPSARPVVVVMSQSGFLEGRIEAANGAPAPNVEVLAGSLKGTSAQAISSDSGTYSIELPPGAYRLSARSSAESAALPDPIAVRSGETAHAPVLHLAASGALVGTVSNRQGAAIAGAVVAASSDAFGGKLLASVTTADDGRYELRNLPPGSCVVQVTANGARRAERRIALHPGQRARQDFTLSSGGAIEGTVVDARGAPIANAVVKGGMRFSDPAMNPAEAETRTGGDGRYVLDGLAAGGARLTALREGSSGGPTRVVDVRESDVTRADFVIGDQGKLAGRVVLAGGRPIDVPVHVNIRPPDVPGDFQARLSFLAEPSGDFELSLPAGDYKVNATRVGRKFGSMYLPVKISSGMTTRQDLELPATDDTEQIQATIIDVGGVPAPGATLIIRTRLGQRALVTTLAADDSGVVSLGGWAQLPADSIELTGLLQGRAGHLSLSKPNVSAVIQLRPAATLRGSVRGAAPERFEVSISPGDGGDLPFNVPALTFYGSSFELPDLPASVAAVRVVTNDGRSGQQTVTLRSGQASDVAIELAGAGAVTGRVIDISGKPLMAFLSLDGGDADAPGVDGVIHLDGIPLGDHALRVTVSRDYESVTRQFHVRSGELVQLGDIELKPSRVAPGEIGWQIVEAARQPTVAWLFPGGPAATAGVREGDQILGIDGRPVSDPTDAYARTSGPPGSVVTLLMKRDGIANTIQVRREIDHP